MPRGCQYFSFPAEKKKSVHVRKISVQNRIRGTFFSCWQVEASEWQVFWSIWKIADWTFSFLFKNCDLHTWRHRSCCKSLSMTYNQKILFFLRLSFKWVLSCERTRKVKLLLRKRLRKKVSSCFPKLFAWTRNARLICFEKP